jgi:hypothetical protein
MVRTFRPPSPDFCRLEVGFPIRISADQSLFAAPHGFSQRTTSFIACACQGIHRTPLRHLIALIFNARPFRALTARERTAGMLQDPDPEGPESVRIASTGDADLQLHRRAGGTAGKTSVTRELPVGEAVKLRQLSLARPFSRTAGASGQLFSSRCQQTGSSPPWEHAANLRSFDKQQPHLESCKGGGARRDRTDDLLLAKQALSQLSYGPAGGRKAERKRTCSRAVCHRTMVGLSRVELLTSPLSGVRSNQLSYRP